MGIYRALLSLLCISVFALAPVAESVADMEPAGGARPAAPQGPVAVLEGEGLTLTGRIRPTVSRLVYLERRSSSATAWTRVAAQIVPISGAYVFNIGGIIETTTFRVRVPATRRAGTLWRKQTSTGRRIQLDVQTAVLTTPSSVRAGTSDLTATFTPARPGRSVTFEVTLRDGTTHTVETVEVATGLATAPIDLAVTGVAAVVATASSVGATPAAGATGTLRVLPRTAPEIEAHRGGYVSSGTAENTMPAFRQAITYGVDYLGTDAHRTKDGVWILLHDPDLRRTTNVEDIFPDRPTYNVRFFTYAEIQMLSARRDGQLMGPLATVQEVAQLAVEEQVEVWIENKIRGSAGADLVRAIGQVPGAIAEGRDDPVTVMSFDPDTLMRAREANPDVDLGLISSSRPDPALYTWVNDLVVLASSIEAGDAEAARAQGLSLFAYTLNKETDLLRAADLGVHGVVTDVPKFAGVVFRGDAP